MQIKTCFCTKLQPCFSWSPALSRHQKLQVSYLSLFSPQTFPFGLHEASVKAVHPHRLENPPEKKRNAGNSGSYAALIFLIHDLLLLKSKVFLKGWPSPLIPQTRKFISWRIGVQENKVRIQMAAFRRFFTWFIFVVGVSLLNISSCWEDGWRSSEWMAYSKVGGFWQQPSSKHGNSFQHEPFKFGSALSGVLAFDVSGKSYEGVNNFCTPPNSEEDNVTPQYGVSPAACGASILPFKLSVRVLPLYVCGFPGRLPTAQNHSGKVSRCECEPAHLSRWGWPCLKLESTVALQLLGGDPVSDFFLCETHFGGIVVIQWPTSPGVRLH